MELTLSPRCGPILRMRLAPDQEWEALHEKSVGVSEGDLDGKLKLRFIGYEKHHDARLKEAGEPPTVDAVGLVLAREIQDWFTEAPFKEDNLRWLIHQREEDQDGFSFVNQMVEDRFDPTYDVHRIDGVFEPLSCVARHASWSNHRFLEHLTNFLGYRTESVWGWSVFNDPGKPLRMLHHEEPISLDKEWEVPSDQTVPHALTGAKSFQVFSRFECDTPLKFFDRVSNLGKQLYTSKLNSEVKGRTDQLMLAPGMVTFNGSKFLCRDIRYLFDADHLTGTLSLEEPVWKVPQPLFPSFLFDGEFSQWKKSEDGDGILEIEPNPEGRWSVLDDSGHYGSRPLRSKIVMPGRSRGALKGYYVKHAAGDPMAVSISEGQTPISPGGIQFFSQDAEEFDLSVGAETIDVKATEKIGMLAEKEMELTGQDKLTATGKDVEIPFGSSLNAGGGVIDAKKSKVVILNKVEMM